MRSPSALQPHSDAERQHVVPARAAHVRPAARTHAAANDESRAPGFSVYGDPLFGMAIGTIVVFALLAALMGLG